MSAAVELRPYEPSDRDACLAIFDSNVGEFLHAEERDGFLDWLGAPEGRFFVLVENGEPVGCGGWVVDDGTLRLTWGLLRSDRHGRRLGELLLVERLVHGFRATGVGASTLGTTPRVEPFFARVGFSRTRFEPDGWGPGLDRVDMRLDQDDAARNALETRLRELRELHRVADA